MKFKYYFMSVVMTFTAFAGFTSCNDDEETIIDAKPSELVVPSEATRVKIGAENRVALPVISGNGEYSAYSLHPDIADIVTGEDGQTYIEGYKNGSATIVVSDAANQYKCINVSVYTTEQIELNHNEFTFETPLGLSATTQECHVVLGNGGYTIESNNPKVVASIDPETGAITLTATSAKNQYIAIVTVHDCTGLSANITVTVDYNLDPFTQSDLDALMAKTADEAYIKSDRFSETCNVDCDGYGWRYGQWTDSDGDDGNHTFGWWEPDYGDYGGHYIIYANNTPLNTEVAATYKFKYNRGATIYELPGTAKVIKDDDEAKVVVWWDVDIDNEVINRGWIVHMK